MKARVSATPYMAEVTMAPCSHAASDKSTRADSSGAYEDMARHWREAASHGITRVNGRSAFTYKITRFPV